MSVTVFIELFMYHETRQTSIRYSSTVVQELVQCGFQLPTHELEKQIMIFCVPLSQSQHDFLQYQLPTQC